MRISDWSSDVCSSDLHVAGHHAKRELGTSVLGQEISLPVIISPTGVQAVHPDGEVAVARAAAARGTIMGLSNFASQSVEEATAPGATTFFPLYWPGNRDVLIQWMHPPPDAGSHGLLTP